MEIWPTCLVYPKGYRLALTLRGKDFELPGATGMMKGSGIFMTSAADRPAPEFAGMSTLHTGGAHASYLLLPRIPGSTGMRSTLHPIHQFKHFDYSLKGGTSYGDAERVLILAEMALSLGSKGTP